MLKNTLVVSAITGTLLFASGFAVAADQDRTQTKTKTQARTQDQIYGSQIMTRQERTAYRNKMRSAKTAEEREQIRTEHHALMQARAKERGVTLPDAPPARGGGMGPGNGMMQGGGMGSGSGMGPGGGMMQGGGKR
ncbi:MAG: hypothetical protein PHQ60_15930 [Sideroxydans sp.]|nr:hypothetical protein [Sideroxydans sp.]